MAAFAFAALSALLAFAAGLFIYSMSLFKYEALFSCGLLCLDSDSLEESEYQDSVVAREVGVCKRSVLLFL